MGGEVRQCRGKDWKCARVVREYEVRGSKGSWKSIGRRVLAEEGFRQR